MDSAWVLYGMGAAGIEGMIGGGRGHLDYVLGFISCCQYGTFSYEGAVL